MLATQPKKHNMALSRAVLEFLSQTWNLNNAKCVHFPCMFRMRSKLGFISSNSSFNLYNSYGGPQLKFLNSADSALVSYGLMRHD